LTNPKVRKESMEILFDIFLRLVHQWMAYLSL